MHHHLHAVLAIALAVLLLVPAQPVAASSSRASHKRLRRAGTAACPARKHVTSSNKNANKGSIAVIGSGSDSTETNSDTTPDVNSHGSNLLPTHSGQGSDHESPQATESSSSSLKLGSATTRNGAAVARPTSSSWSRFSSTSVQPTPSTSSSHHHHHHHDQQSSNGPAPAQSPAAKPSPASSGNGNGNGNSNSKPQSTSPLPGAGLFSFVDKTCGKSGATQDITKTSGPNGAMDFLNCGLYDNNGWTPPAVMLEDVLALSLDEALASGNSPFQACQPYLKIFDKYAQQTGLPAILIASIAMQESSCNADTMGDNGGAYGLMQITQDKCTDGINCSDPDYNIKTGANYLKQQLDANDGNILMALGTYNGWYPGLTVAKATAIKSQCCECQNNLNYMQQMLNGWLQNVDGSTLGDWNMGC